MKALSRSDEILLLTILRLNNDTSGITIVQEIEDRSGKKLTFGALWVSLDILAKKDLIAKRMEDPCESGGRKKIYYSVTSNGIAALEATRDLNKKFWHGMNPVIDGAKGVS